MNARGHRDRQEKAVAVHRKISAAARRGSLLFAHGRAAAVVLFLFGFGVFLWGLRQAHTARDLMHRLRVLSRMNKLIETKTTAPQRSAIVEAALLPRSLFAWGWPSDGRVRVFSTACPDSVRFFASGCHRIEAWIDEDDFRRFMAETLLQQDPPWCLVRLFVYTPQKDEAVRIIAFVAA